VSRGPELAQCSRRVSLGQRAIAPMIALLMVVGTGLSVVAVSVALETAAGGFTIRPSGMNVRSAPAAKSDPKPHLSTITPSRGTYTTVVTLTGRNLATAMVHFDGVTVAPVMDTTSRITVRAPSGVFGNVTVDVTTPGGTSNRKPFHYLTPFIRFIRPTSGTAGTIVFIHGLHFDTTSAPTVTFGGTPARILFYSRGLIKVEAPPGFGTQPVHVTTVWGTSNAAFFTYRKFSGPMP